MNQVADDGQTQARAAIAPCGRGISLRERLEQPFLLRLGHAAAAITHADVEDDTITIVVARCDANHDVALLGELNGIGHQVEQDLTQS